MLAAHLPGANELTGFVIVTTQTFKQVEHMKVN